MADLKTGLQHRTSPKAGGPKRVLPNGQVKRLGLATKNGQQRLESNSSSSPIKQAAKSKAIGWMIGAMGLTGGGIGLFF